MEVSDSGEIKSRHIRPFAEFLHEQRKGALANELSDGLNAVVDAVNTHRKNGSITLKITVKSNGDGMVMVSDDLTVKLPEGERPEVYFFVDDDFNLSRSNPNQPELPLREVTRPDAADAKEA